MAILYCPCCGESSEMEEEFELAPYEFEVVCPLCEMKWKIKIVFAEMEAEEGMSLKH